MIPEGLLRSLTPDGWSNIVYKPYFPVSKPNISLLANLRLIELGRFLRKDDIKDLRDRVEKALTLGEILIPRGSKIEGFSFEGGEVFSVNDYPSFFIGKNKVIIPLLVYALRFSLPLPRITVDMKAVPHICNGADIFRPGVRSIDVNIKSGQTILVVDEKNLKPICIGICLMDGKPMQETRQGKVVENVHYVGDDLWDFSRSLNVYQPKAAEATNPSNKSDPNTI